MPLGEGNIVDLVRRSPKSILQLPKPTVELRAQYLAEQPYPHLVIDNFVAPDVADQICQTLLNGQEVFRETFTDDYQRNKTISTGDDVPVLFQALAAKFGSPYMLRYLEALTGAKSLIGDPYYNTEYGYYHIVGKGGILGSHVDHSHHQSMGIPHVLNLVFYMTPDWSEQDGGALCLYDARGQKVVKRVSCRFNRAIIFACNPAAFHGVEPVAADCERRRHSLYFAYYKVSPERASYGEVPPHLQAGTPGAPDQMLQHGTYFVVRFGDLFKRRNRPHLKARIHEAIGLFMPPIVPLTWRKLWRRRSN